MAERQAGERGATAEAGPSDEVIDFERYLPTVLSKLVSKLRRSANEFFGQRYGLSLIEWRIISFLAANGPSSSYAIWTEGELDKAAVSRSVRALQRNGLVEVTSVPASHRKKTAVALTEKGRRIHAETFAEVVARHGRLVEGFSEDDLEMLLASLRKLEAQIPDMGRRTPVSSRFRPTKSTAKATDPPRPGSSDSCLPP